MVTASNSPDRESQSRELAGMLHLISELTSALKAVAPPDHELLDRAERYAIFQDGYIGRPGTNFSVLMKFEGARREAFFKGTI